MLQILLLENPESNILPCESHTAIIQQSLWMLWQRGRERKDKQQSFYKAETTKSETEQNPLLNNSIVLD